MLRLLFDRGRLHVAGYRLPAPGARAYQPILAQAGLYTSRVLGLDLRLEGTRLRFYHAAAALPDSNELIKSRERMVDDAESRVRAAEERAADAERKLAEAQAEIERLKAERGSP